MGILTDVLQVVTHERERFAGRPFLQSDNPFYSFWIENIAANAVTGIGGVTDYGSLVNLFDYSANETELRVIRVNLDNHGSMSDAGCPAAYHLMSLKYTHILKRWNFFL